MIYFVYTKKEEKGCFNISWLLIGSGLQVRRSSEHYSSEITVQVVIRSLVNRNIRRTVDHRHFVQSRLLKCVLIFRNLLWNKYSRVTIAKHLSREGFLPRRNAIHGAIKHTKVLFSRSHLVSGLEATQNSIYNITL